MLTTINATYMKKILILTASAVICASSMAQVNAPDGAGYLLRAEKMLNDENYVGCIDQANKALTLPLTPQQAEKAAFVRASAAVHTNKQEAKRLALDFLAAYPASEWRHEARMLLGDCYYGSDYAEALKVYSTLDPQYLPPAKADDLLYRMGYSYLQTKEYDKALSCFNQLGGSKQYAKAAAFYRGYIAYAQGKMAEAKTLLQKARSNEAPGNMADYYLCQIDYLNKDYSSALTSAKSLLRRTGIANEYVAEANRIAGESAFQLGDLEQAEKYLLAYQAMEPDPQSSALYILGLFAYNEGDYDKAVKLFTPATEAADAMSQSAYLYIGQSLLKEGDVDGAILAFDKAVNLDFDESVQEAAYYNYAVASLQGGKVPFGNSLATFESFLSKFPESRYAPEAQKYVIAAYVNSRNYDAALKSINAMKNPTDDTYRAKQKVLYCLGAQELKAGNAKQAIAYLTDAQGLARYDANVDLENALLLGEAYYGNGQWDAAATQARKYINGAKATNANRAVAYYDLGYALFQQEKYADAAQQFKRMIDTQKGMPANIVADAYARLGDSQRATQQFAQAAESYDQSHKLNPQVGDYAMLQKGIMEGYQRHHSQKIALLKDMIAEYPTSALIPDALLEMTESYIQMGDNKNAIATYRELVAKYPNTAQGRQGYLQMALTMLNSGDRSGAIDAYKQVITRYPTSEEAALASEQLKRLYAADGKLGEYMAFLNTVPNAPKMEASEAESISFEVAEKSYLTEGKHALLEQYVAQYPDGANRGRALAYLIDACDGDKAYQYACELLADYPDSHAAVDALSIKGEQELADGKGVLALRTFQELEKKASGSDDIDYARLKVAECAMLCDDTAEALRACDALAASSSLSTADRTQALFIKGVAEAKQGDTAAARQAWQEAADAGLALEYGIRAAYSLAESHYRAGDYKAAETAAKAVTDADTPHTYWVARGFILLSDVYAKQGNEFKAQQYLKSLRDNYPGNEPDIFQMIDQRIK